MIKTKVQKNTKDEAIIQSFYVPDKMSDQIYNLVLAIDYVMSFYQRSLYNKAQKDIVSNVSFLENKYNSFCDINENYILEKTKSNLSLINNICNINTNIYNVALVNIQDVRDKLSIISLSLQILSNREIINKDIVAILLVSISNIQLLISDIIKDNTLMADIIKDDNDKRKEGETPEDNFIVKDDSRLVFIESDIRQLGERDVRDILKSDVSFNRSSYNKETPVELNNKVNKEQIVQKIIKDIRAENINTDDSEDRNSSRKARIMSCLQKGGMMSIKDIADNVPGCSEKTIQRDLNLLLDRGLIKKTGEKRWSRYSV